MLQSGKESILEDGFDHLEASHKGKFSNFSFALSMNLSGVVPVNPLNSLI